MNPKLLKGLVLLIAGFAAFTIGNKIFMYFTHDKKPHIILQGLEHEHSYKGELHCSALTDNSYKVDVISAQLDGEAFPLPNNGTVGAKKASLPIDIDTTRLPDGKHTLSLEIVDSSKNKNKNSLNVDFYVDNTPLQAAFLDDKFTVAQGKTLHLKMKANKPLQKASLTLGTKTYPIYQAEPTSTIYECFIPIDCEELPNDIALTAELIDAVNNAVTLKNKVTVQAFAFKKQKRVDYSMQQKLDAEKELSNNDQVLENAIQKWVKDSPTHKLWSGPFELPTQAMQIITPHGEIRVTPTRGRYMHKGIDVTNHPRSVIWAAQNGKVIIKDRFLLTGNTVVIDHGLGITTLYAHLDDFADIEVGDMVKKGNPIGKLGKTGYATGYHLHWELRVHGVAVDPLEWTKTIY